MKRGCCLEVNMPDQLFPSSVTPKCVGIAADHGGYALKEYLVRMLREAGADVLAASLPPANSTICIDLVFLLRIIVKNPHCACQVK